MGQTPSHHDEPSTTDALSPTFDESILETMKWINNYDEDEDEDYQSVVTMNDAEELSQNIRSSTRDETAMTSNDFVIHELRLQQSCSNNNNNNEKTNLHVVQNPNSHAIKSAKGRSLGLGDVSDSSPVADPTTAAVATSSNTIFQRLRSLSFQHATKSSEENDEAGISRKRASTDLEDGQTIQRRDHAKPLAVLLTTTERGKLTSYIGCM
jgi:hypothetical protein